MSSPGRVESGAPGWRWRSMLHREGLPWQWLLLCFAVALVLIALRSPDRFTFAQFYAEDGVRWYADAYNLGWLRSFAEPTAGYLNTLQRLGIGPALLLPLPYAPLEANLFGLLVQGLPVVVLLSGRCRGWAPLPVRALFAAVYVLVPNAHEIHVVLTNSQWHFALALALLAFSEPPRTRAGRVADVAVFLLGGFSGPFAILLLPLMLVFWWVRRRRWTPVQAALMLAGVAVQIAMLITHPAARLPGVLGATPRLFLRILGGNVFLAGVLGGLNAGKVPYLVALLAVLGGVGLLLYTMRAAPLELKLFVVFCFMLLPPALHSPLIISTEPQWQVLLYAQSSRYWYFPMMAFLWSAAWCWRQARLRVFRYAGAGVLLLLPVGIVRDWRSAPMPDQHFREGVARLEAARSGEHVRIQLFPADWKMELVKK